MFERGHLLLDDTQDLGEAGVIDPFDAGTAVGGDDAEKLWVRLEESGDKRAASFFEQAQDANLVIEARLDKA